VNSISMRKALSINPYKLTKPVGKSMGSERQPALSVDPTRLNPFTNLPRE